MKHLFLAIAILAVMLATPLQASDCEDTTYSTPTLYGDGCD